MLEITWLQTVKRPSRCPFGVVCRRFADDSGGAFGPHLRSVFECRLMPPKPCAKFPASKRKPDMKTKTNIKAGKKYYKVKC